MRVAVIAVLSAFFAALVAALSPSFAWEIRAMNEQIEKTNVLVSNICSGTVISMKHRLVLTAHHCITDNLHEVVKTEVDQKTGEIKERKVMEAAPMFVEIRKVQDYDVVSFDRMEAKIVGYNNLADIAILQVIDESWKPEMEAPLAPDAYEYLRGKPVFAVGNPAIEFDNSVTTGIISAPARKVDFGNGIKFPLFQHSANTIGGNSGGAIYNDEGQIIGTVTGGIRGSDVSLAIPVSFTKALLEQLGFSDVIKN